MELPKRKHIRLSNYDYSQPGVYFVTICTAHRKATLSEIIGAVGPDALIGPHVRLTEIGRIVERFILRTEQVYPSVKVEHYVIMPNHIHLLMSLNSGPVRAPGPTKGEHRPDLPQIVKALKGLTTRAVKCSIWQSGYYEHIIRDENDFLTRWQYIDQNPVRWTEDEYYGEER